MAAGRLPVSVRHTQRAGQGGVGGDVLASVGWVSLAQGSRAVPTSALQPGVEMEQFPPFLCLHLLRDLWPVLRAACPAWAPADSPLWDPGP